MRLMIFVLLVFTGTAALVLWLFPLWLGIPLVVLTGIPLIWVMWKIRGLIKKLKHELGDLFPKEKTEMIAANAPFRGQGFTFTFPVACEVSQIQLQDFEALMVKPKFAFAGAPKDTLLVASTFSRAELKEKINETIEKICSQIEQSQTEESAPVTVGSFAGERRAFAAAHGGKSLKGEAVYLDILNGSIVWVAIAPDDLFDELASKYRELAVLVQRVDAVLKPASQAVIDV